MDLEQAVARRRMVRSFTAEPVPPEVVDDLLRLARRAPSAGNTQAVEFLVLDTPDAVSAYWDVTLPRDRRASFRWQSLLEAPVLVVVVVRPEAYPERYSEPDKINTGRGAGTEAWPVPYWWVDSGAVIQNLLLGVVERGLGACLFGTFDHESAVRHEFGVPEGHRLVATIALGHPGEDQPGRSKERPRPPLSEVIHRSRW